MKTKALISDQLRGNDQLRGYREADLRLCFRICKMFVFSFKKNITQLVKMKYFVPKLKIYNMGLGIAAIT